MSLSLIKVTNAGIKLTNGMVVPVLKAVVSGSGNTDMNSLYNEIYARSIGMVSATCPFNSSKVFDVRSIPNGTRTYGDTTGFSFEVVKQSDYGIYSNALYFKGNLCGKTWNYTGYATYPCCHFVLFVDENNHVYIKGNGSSESGLYVLYSDNPGCDIRENAFAVTAVMSGYTLRNWSSPTQFNVTTDDISNYISGEIDPTKTDPYNPAGESSTGGGTGDFDGTSYSVDIPNLPSLSAVDTGFISLFNPSATQLKSLANYMWGDLFDIDTWKKIFANPMDAILGLSIVPVNVPGGESETVSVGNISTGISMTKASSQYVAVDCGTLNVNEYWGAYLDYDPYTKAEIYLPFIGAHPLAVDDIMGKSVHVVYHVDILSGSCCAYIKCGNSVLYSFVGQCSCSIPITGNDWTNVVNGALSIAASIGTMVATGGASAPMSIPNIASTAVNNLKPNVERSGSMGGMGGMLGIQKPYLILTRPRQALPANQNEYMGYPAFITMELSDCDGYTEIESIHLNNVPATERELEEIETLLKSGVII